jgi:phosphoribosylformylglycinamidine synthase
LFSETQSRILVSVAPERAGELERLAEERAVPLSRLGVTGGDALEFRVNGETAISREVASLREAWWTAIERGLTA